MKGIDTLNLGEDGGKLSPLDCCSNTAEVAATFVLNAISSDFFNLSPGILIGLVCGLSFAVYNMIGNACKKYHISTTTITFYSFFVSSALWIMALPFLNIDEIPFSLENLLYIGFIVIFATAIPYWLLMYGLRHVNVLPATILGMLDPLVAGLFAFLLVGEILTIPNMIGIGIIISAVCIFTAKETKKIR